MNLRPMLAAAVALLGVLATAPAEAAPAYRMDGRKARTQRYEGVLTTPAYPSGPRMPDPTMPHPSDCTPASCDLRELRLVLPRGTSWGRFRATIVAPTELTAALVLYDAKYAPLQIDEVWRSNGSVEPVGECCPDPSTYQLDVYVNMLPSGTYHLGVVDRAGVGKFTAKVDWTAHPPDRPSGRPRR